MANLLSSLFSMQTQQQTQPTNNIQNIISMVRSGNPEQIARQMMQNNPNFRQFIEQNKGKTPDQVAKEHGIDLSKVMQKLK